MRTFLLVWSGQLVSTIGSYMTFFALTLWAWDATSSATALALVGFFSRLPSIPITLIAGLIVDRCNRKRLMLLGDAIAAFSTLAIGLLYLTDQLQLWHLYGAAMLNGGFGQIQLLAYKASLSSIVPTVQLTRANSMNSVVHYGSVIVGPALAGILHPLIGLPGILIIDLLTFGVAVSTLIACTIPQPEVEKPPEKITEREPLLTKLTFGFRVVWRQPNLRVLLLITTLFWFFHDLGGAVYRPMILARSDGSATALASVSSAAGIGGVMGAILLSLHGGPKRKVKGMLAGFIGAGLCKTVLGLGRSPTVWVPAQFCSSLNFPLLGSSENVLWMQSITAEKQGRVFAANSLVLQGGSAIAALIAGPLAEGIFEPWLTAQDIIPVLSVLLNSDPGAGIALLYVLTSLCLILVGTVGGSISQLWMIETPTSDFNNPI